ncbi:MAG: hypothetical protein Q4B92_05020 [Ruminococcus sp.]|nr:hypothetical protein [Ruminococcus sp.]
MRYSYSGKIDTVSNKYGYEYIRVAALKQAIIPLLMSFVYIFFALSDFKLLYTFIGAFQLTLAATIVHGVNSYKFNVTGSMIFLGAYTFTAYELYTIGVIMLGKSILSITDINMPLFVFTAVFGVVITVNFIVLLINVIRSFRYEAIKRKTRNCKLDIYDEKVVGVALDNSNKEMNFELNLSDIKSVNTVDANLKAKKYYNFLLCAKNGNEYKLALSSAGSAREEVKYIIKEIEKGNKPYPKKACTKCGFYLIDERCPNCQKFSL